jgi:hypothetical protein
MSVQGYVFACFYVEEVDEWIIESNPIEMKSKEGVYQWMKHHWLEDKPTESHILRTDPAEVLLMTHTDESRTNDKDNPHASDVGWALSNTLIAVQGNCAFFAETSGLMRQVLEAMGI